MTSVNTIINKGIAPHRKINFKEGEIPTERQMTEYINLGHSKYNKEYHCSNIVKLLKEGKSKAEVCKKFKICPATLEIWIKSKEEFRQAYEYGMACAQVWWEELALEVIFGRINNKNAVKLITFMLEKRFRKSYGDNKFYHITSEQKFTELTDEELDERIKQRIKEIKIRDFTGKSVVNAEFKEING